MRRLGSAIKADYLILGASVHAGEPHYNDNTNHHHHHHHHH